MRHVAVVLPIALALVSRSATSDAQPSAANRALAETLFQEGKKLIAAGQLQEGCAKLEESQRLDPAGGTLLNVALCHEQEGKTATAWSEYAAALAMARRDGRADRERAAQERIAALEAKLSKLVVQVSPNADVPELEVRQDGTIVGRAAWGTAIPVDPGSHVIAASSPGRSPWTHTVEVTNAGETVTVNIPPLQLEAPAHSAEPPSTSQPPQPASQQPQPAEVSGGTTGGGARTVGFIVGGLGLVAIGVGTFFGIRALSKRSESDTICNADECPATDDGRRGLDLNEQAQTAAHASDLALGAGVVALGVGTVLVLLGGPRDKPRSGGHLVPAVAPRGAGIGWANPW